MNEDKPPTRRVLLPDGRYVTSLRDDIARRALEAAKASLRDVRVFEYVPREPPCTKRPDLCGRVRCECGERNLADATKP